VADDSREDAEEEGGGVFPEAVFGVARAIAGLRGRLVALGEKCMRFLSPALLVTTVALALARPAMAQVVWADDFAGESNGASPTSDFAGGTAGNDYVLANATANSKFAITTGIGNAAPGLSLVDAADADSPTLTVTMAHFAPFTVSAVSATPVLRVTFDLRVDAYLTTASSNIPRFILRADNQTATGSQLVIGFGYGNLNDGDGSTQDLTLFAETQTGTTTNIAPRDGSAIGLNAGTGWSTGFNFGDYDGGAEAANDTNDEFYRVTFDYDAVTGGISGSVTQVATGNVAALPSGLALTAGKAFSNTDSTDRFLLASSTSNTTTAYFDNFRFEAVPEPGSAALLAGGAGLLLGRRRRRAGR
jgi:hypothetical protein